MRDPSKFTDKQKDFHHRNKRRTNIGRCIICGSETTWNEDKGKYERLCSDKCKAEFSKVTKARIKDIYGTDNLAADPNFQRDKLLSGRSIAREYQFKDGGDPKIVLSSVEVAILDALEKLGFKSCDVDAPSKIVINYEFDGKKLNHIPDVFVPDLNLIISAKDSLASPNRHPNFIKDRAKNLAIYNHIVSNTKYNYAQIEGTQEAKATKMIIDACKYQIGSKGRFILPPRIDFVIYNESTVLPYAEDGNFELLIISYDDNGKFSGSGLIKDIYDKRVYCKTVDSDGNSGFLIHDINAIIDSYPKYKLFKISDLNIVDVLSDTKPTILNICDKYNLVHNNTIDSIVDVIENSFVERSLKYYNDLLKESVINLNMCGDYNA